MTIGKLGDWLAAYKNAWVCRDPEAAAQLFSEEAAYFESPFAPPARGKRGIRDYWSAATRNQSDITFSWEIVGLIEKTGFVRWQASFERMPQKTRVELDGVFVLEFDDAGLCKTLREWWHRQES